MRSKCMTHKTVLTLISEIMFGDDVNRRLFYLHRSQSNLAAQPVIGVFSNIKIVMRKYRTESGIFYENNSFAYAHEEGALFVQMHTPESE